ncbi:insecticidal delta-endotoxin Cry8Ea1 family protein [Bacillus cereus]|uniref:insecticidal delta-endotoxin Cry8Ea1 family protein n=1 Tax=Bacillus cereus TaxID=1396 RepID=UPI003A8E8458
MFMPNIDQTIQELPKITSASKYKTSLDTAAKAIPNIIKGVNEENINNTAKALAVFGTSLIPYVGILISPLIGLLWPELGGSKTLQQMRQEISDEIDTKIKDSFKEYDLTLLQKKIEPFFERIQKFERLINKTTGIEYKRSAYSDMSSNILSPSDYYAEGTPDQTARAEALGIASKFDEIIASCTKDPQGLLVNMDTWEFPIYVLLATAHLQFLYFITKNGKKEASEKIQFDDETLKIHFSEPLQKKVVEYRDYIERTYKKGYEQFVLKMQSLANGSNDRERLQYLKNQIDYYKYHNGPHTSDSGLVKKYEDTLKKYEKLITERDKYLKLTINSEMFNMAVPGHWEPRADGTLKNVFDVGASVPKYRWLNDNHHYYYLDPYKEGLMKTGWFLDLNEKWYYFNPQQGDPNHNTSFAVGEMFANTSAVINGIRYNFDADGSCKDPYSTDRVIVKSSALRDGTTYRIGVAGTNHFSKPVDTFLAINEHKLDATDRQPPYESISLFKENQADRSQKWVAKFDSNKKAYQFINQDNDWVLAWNPHIYGRNDTYVIGAPNLHKDEHYWILSPADNGLFYMQTYANQSKHLYLTQGYTNSGRPIDFPAVAPYGRETLKVNFVEV